MISKTKRGNACNTGKLGHLWAASPTKSLWLEIKYKNEGAVWNKILDLKVLNIEMREQFKTKYLIWKFYFHLLSFHLFGKTYFEEACSFSIMFIILGYWSHFWFSSLLALPLCFVSINMLCVNSWSPDLSVPELHQGWPHQRCGAGCQQYQLWLIGGVCVSSHQT